MLIKINNNKFNVKYYNNFILNILGLMFRRIKEEGLLMEFNRERYIALHTFFVFHKLDIIYIDKYLKIKKIRKNIIPFTFYIPHVKCKYILEVRDLKNIKLNDILKFKNK